MAYQEIILDVETIKHIIEKLEQSKESLELNLTDWDKCECTEDRMSIAEEYIECGNLISYLKQKLYGN